MSPTADKRRGRSPSKSTRTALDDDHSSDEQSPPGMAVFDSNFRPQQRGGRRRRPFTPARRSEVAGVRKLGACEYHRKKKISCKHPPETINCGASPTLSTSARIVDSFKAEDPDLHLGNNSTVLPQPEVEGEHLPLVVDSMASNDSMEWMLRTVPAVGKHLDRIALEIHDFHALFEDPSTTLVDPSHSVPDWRSFPYDSSSEPEMQLSEPSSRSDYPLLSPLSPTSSSASEGDFNVAHPPAASVFYCQVQGCDLRHGFALEFDLRCHQESRHPHSFPPRVTFTCPVDGCRHQLWPFVRKDNLEDHKRRNHPDFVQYEKGQEIVDTENIDPVGLGKRYKFDQYLAGMNNDYVVFPQRIPVPGENPPWLQRGGRVTTSSRGGAHMAPPRRQADNAQNTTEPRMIPLRPAPPQSNEGNWVNSTVSYPPNDMRYPSSLGPSPYVQASPLAQPAQTQLGFPAGDMSFSHPHENPYGQQSQFYGPPPPPPVPVNYQPMYPDLYMGSMFPQQGFVSPSELPNRYPMEPPRQGPEIRFQQPSLHESDGFNGTSSSFMPSPIGSSPANFANPYLGQQRWPMNQTPQFIDAQNLPVNNNSLLSVDGTNSISDNYDFISHNGSPVTFSSNSSDFRRPSVASPYPVVTQGYSLPHSPPVLEPSAISTSSVASPYTLVESPMVDVTRLSINGFEHVIFESDAENTAEGFEDVTVKFDADNTLEGLAFYGLASEESEGDVAIPRDMSHG